MKKKLFAISFVVILAVASSLVWASQQYTVQPPCDNCPKADQQKPCCAKNLKAQKGGPDCANLKGADAKAAAAECDKCPKRQADCANCPKNHADCANCPKHAVKAPCANCPKAGQQLPCPDCPKAAQAGQGCDKCPKGGTKP